MKTPLHWVSVVVPLVLGLALFGWGAGLMLPYQDAPVLLQIQYEQESVMGSVLMTAGAVLIVLSAMALFFLVKRSVALRK